MTLHNVSENSIDRLREHFVHHGRRPECWEDWRSTWYAGGDALHILEEYLVEPFEVVAQWHEGDYQGRVAAVIVDEETGTHYAWCDYYGSCSGCDALDGAPAGDGYTFVRSTLSSGDVQAFPDRNGLVRWLVKKDVDGEYGYQWDESVRVSLLRALLEADQGA